MSPPWVQLERQTSRRVALATGLRVIGAAVLGTAVARLAACDTPAAGLPPCAQPSAGKGTRYCLSEAAIFEIPGGLELAIGQTLVFNVDDNTAVVVGRDAGGYFARSAICTHACCIVTLCGDDACASLAPTPRACSASAAVMSQHVLCPCHGSVFQLSDGAPLSGPARKPLPAYQIIVGATLSVDTGVLVPADMRA